MPSKNIEKIIEEFKEKFLDKWLPKEMDVLTLDGDSRGMRQRAKDFLRSSLSETEKRVRKETIEEVIRMLPYEIKSRLTNLLNEKE